MKLPCDCILLAGEVMVNESILTGESCPVRKQQLDLPKGYNKDSILFEGTNILKCKGYKEGNFKGNLC